MEDSNITEKTLVQKIQDLVDRNPSNFDIYFSVGKQKKIVGALKIILKASSPVLEKEFKEKWEVAVVKEGDGIPLPYFDPIAFELFVKLTSLDTWSQEILDALNLPLNLCLNLLKICRRFGMNKAAENVKNLPAVFSHFETQPQPLESVSSLQLPVEASLPNTICFHRTRHHAAVVVENFVYSFGGAQCSSDASDALEVQHLNVIQEEMGWTHVPVKYNPTNPSQRQGHSAVAHKEFVFIFGGFDENMQQMLNSTYSFNTRTLTWDKQKVTGTTPAPRWLHTAVILREEMFIYGGNGDGVNNELHSLNLETFHWSTIETKGVPPALRTGHTATVHNDKLIHVFGGFDFNARKVVNTIWSFDVDNKMWTEVKTSGTPPSGRSHHCAIVHNGLMYVFGGNDGNYLNDLHSYNPETFKWYKVSANGEAPPGRNAAASATFNDKVFIFGGFNLVDMYLDDTAVLKL